MGQSHIKKAIVIVSMLAAVLVPSVASAVTFSSLVAVIIAILDTSIVPLLIGIAVFLTAFGIFRYISAGDDPKKLAEAGKLIMWGVIGVFVMLSMWGFVKILINTVFSPANTGSFIINDQLWNIPSGS